jgi:hypothetical protein
LTCKSGDIDDEEFNFSGLLHCRFVSLYSSDSDDVSSLLVEDLPQTADWEGRARFLLNHVVGKCAAIPDWGAERSFLLRRMRILLGVHNVELSGSLQYPGELGGTIRYPEIESYKFIYNITPDDNAISPIARKSETSEPWWFGVGENCIEEVLKKK